MLMFLDASDFFSAINIMVIKLLQPMGMMLKLGYNLCTLLFIGVCHTYSNGYMGQGLSSACLRLTHMKEIFLFCFKAHKIPCISVFEVKMISVNENEWAEKHVQSLLFNLVSVVFLCFLMFIVNCGIN